MVGDGIIHFVYVTKKGKKYNVWSECGLVDFNVSKYSHFGTKVKTKVTCKQCIRGLRSRGNL